MAGGVNSLDNFARSWQRASLFPEIAPQRRGSVVIQDDESETVPRDEEETVAPHKSLLRQQLESSPDQNREPAVVEDPASREELSSVNTRLLGNEVFSHTLPGTPLGRTPSASYGTWSSRLNDESRRHVAELFTEHEAGSKEPDKETEPLLVKQVQRDDGTKAHMIVGQSTLPQTVFNSVNVLIGVGLLSLPLAVKYAGWVCGMIFLFLSAYITNYTAKLLAICLEADPSLVTYADVAYISFGSKARIVTSILFSLELIAACVALIVLFADSLDALLGGWSILGWKIFCGLVLVPLNFVPLRLLSLTSILGILCAFGIVGIVFIDGLLKPTYPGSLRQPAPTYAFPQTWMTLPLSLGLFMSPWGGHSVFPNIYRDMRHPAKYTRGLRYTYTFTYILDLAMAIVGVLMFGDDTRDEITSNILLSSGYPSALSILIVVFIAIIPLTKVPLNSRPIVSTLEILVGLDPRGLAPDSHLHSLSPFLRNLLSIGIRILTIVIMVIVSIIFPDFDSIMALMGSALCFTICVVLPCLFYLKIYGDEITWTEKVCNWVLILICGGCAVVGTVWAVIPKSKLGIE